MGYVEDTLMAGEQVTHRTRLHWTIFVSLKALLTLFVAPLVARATSEFAVTNRRVIIKVGLVSRRTIELNLEKVESIGVEQTVLGRILAYGTIVVVGTGGTKEPFRGIADPMGFRRAVNEATEALRLRAGAAAR
ncbi:MAG TPA: PH domain-containing protein [Anaeromyxobacter sp.]|nr:PH domain-containing protein [Anaeromyxobacter sp.]